MCVHLRVLVVLVAVLVRRLGGCRRRRVAPAAFAILTLSLHHAFEVLLRTTVTLQIARRDVTTGGSEQNVIT